MKQIEVVAKATYWDAAKLELIPQKVPVKVDAVTTVEEAVVYLRDADRMIEAAVAHQVSAAEKSIVIPPGAWTKEMCSAATKGLRNKPEFAGLKSSAARDAVMGWITKNGYLESLYPVFVGAGSTAATDDEDE